MRPSYFQGSSVVASYASLLLTLLLPSAGPAPAEASFDAEVVTSEAFVFSGPGETYYPTSMLKSGAIVTVLGPATNSYVPILPPPESFSWIPGDAVKENANGSGVISQAGTKVRVGSSLSEAHHVHQVVLEPGARVELIDERNLEDKDGRGRWYKVLPPEGERRYVPASALRVRETGAPLAGSAPTQSTSQSPTQTQAAAPTATSSVSSSPARPVDTLPIAARVGVKIIPPAEPTRRSATDQLTSARSAEAAIPRGKPVPVTDDPTKPFLDRAVHLAGQMTEMRTRLPDQWDLDSVRKTIDALQKSAKSDAEKSAVAELDQFERQMRRLHDRYADISRRREVFLRQDREISSLLKQAQGNLGQFLPNFDAEGMLRRSSVSIDGQETFVLEDARGDVSHYVNFPSGISAESYVGRRVGLLGRVSRRDHVPLPRLEVDQISLIDDRS